MPNKIKKETLKSLVEKHVQERENRVTGPEPRAYVPRHRNKEREKNYYNRCTDSSAEGFCFGRYFP